MDFINLLRTAKRYLFRDPKMTRKDVFTSEDDLPNELKVENAYSVVTAPWSMDLNAMMDGQIVVIVERLIAKVWPNRYEHYSTQNEFKYVGSFFTKDDWWYEVQRLDTSGDKPVVKSTISIVASHDFEGGVVLVEKFSEETGGGNSLNSSSISTLIGSKDMEDVLKDVPIGDQDQPQDPKEMIGNPEFNSESIKQRRKSK